jgi:hypothetical protein
MPTPKVNSWLGWRIFTVNNDLANPIKRVDFGQIWVNPGHHLETLADNHYWSTNGQPWSKLGQI